MWYTVLESKDIWRHLQRKVCSDGSNRFSSLLQNRVSSLFEEFKAFTVCSLSFNLSLQAHTAFGLLMLQFVNNVAEDCISPVICVGITTPHINLAQVIHCLLCWFI